MDAPEKSESVRRELRLPFSILSDAERRVVREWNIYNAKEKGGIAKPAVFILNPDRMVRFCIRAGLVSLRAFRQQRLCGGCQSAIWAPLLAKR